MEIQPHPILSVRIPIIIARWLLLAIGIAAGALNSGCGGGGGANGIDPRASGSTSVLYLAGIDGAVTQSIVAGSSDSPLIPSKISTGANPVAMIVSPDHHFAYVADASTNSVYQYSITSTGALRPLSPTTVSLGSSGSPTDAVGDAGGNYLIVADTTSIISLKVATDGSLTRSASIPAGQPTMSLATSGDLLFATFFSPSGNTLVSAGIRANGSLSQAQAVPLPGVSAWDDLAISNDAVFIVRSGAGTNTGSIAAFSYLGNGSLSAIGSPLDGGNPGAAAVSASGHTVYAVDGPALRTVSVESGKLVEVGVVALPISSPASFTGPYIPAAPLNPVDSVLVDATGGYVYTAEPNAWVMAVPFANEIVAGTPSPIEASGTSSTAAALFGR